MDKVVYLNQHLATPIGGDGNLLEDPMYSKLLNALGELKQGKAGPAQWLGVLKGFLGKGIKQAELDDSAVLDYLKASEPTDKIEKSTLIHRITQRIPLIKRVDLGSPQYAAYVSMTGQYTERLYILSSEGMRADDELEDLMFQIEELGFNPGPLLEDPLMIDRLEARMALVVSARPQMYDFVHHHHSKIVPKHGKNLMAHSRFTQAKDGLFFIQEIQSDWAQKGRRSDWATGYPKAPFVTNTEQWAGLVLKDLLQEAARDPECRQVAWINSNMRNGWSSNVIEGDDLAVFYDTIVRKCAEKILGKSGQRPQPMTVSTKNGPTTVLGFEMTEEARRELAKPQPMYTREGVLPVSYKFAPNEESQRMKERTMVVNECASMLGDARAIRFVARLYDISQGNEVAGQYLNKGITLSLRATKLDRAARHEMWHYAHENLLFDHERREMRIEFSPGAPLNTKTREVLLSMGLVDSAEQCNDPQECAAHAFSLWSEGRLDVQERPKGIFWSVMNSLDKISNWLNETVFGVRIASPDDLFQAMKNGALAVRQQTESTENPSPVPEEMTVT